MLTSLDLLFIQDVYAQYQLRDDSEPTQTKKIKDTKNPDWNFKKQHTMKSVKKEVF